MPEEGQTLKNIESIYYPIKLELERPAKDIMANNSYSYCVYDDDFIKNWGMGYSYVLANGKEIEVKEPWTVSREKFLKDEKVGFMSLGGNHVMYSTADKYWGAEALEKAATSKFDLRKWRKETTAKKKAKEIQMST